MKLSDAAIVQLASWRDPIGIISIFAGVPVENANTKPSSPISLHNQLRDIVLEAKATRPHAEWMTIQAAVDRLAPAWAEMTAPSRPGRGRALFAGVASDRVETFSIQLELPTRAVFNKVVDVLPLLTALDTGRTCGLLSVQRDGVRIDEWRLDATEELRMLPFAPSGTGEWREKKGPANPNPQRAQQSSVHVERFERRLEANRQRFLKSVAKEVSDVARARAWSRLAIFGDPRLGHVLLEAWPARNEDIEMLVDERVINGEAGENVRDSTAELLHSAQRRRELTLVSELRELAGNKGRAALGLHDTLTALNDGRVDHLLVDANAHLSGYRSAEGLLFPPDDGQARPASQVEPEPNLVSSMIQRAIATHARVTPIHDAAAQALATSAGVGAVLRW